MRSERDISSQLTPRQVIARRIVLRRRILRYRRQLPPFQRQPLAPFERRTIPAPFKDTPDWRGGPFEGWAHKWVAKNFWRVSRHFNYERDDAVQECALLYVKCCNRYGGLVDNPKWMMSLFQTSVQRRWLALAQRSTQYANMFDATTVSEDQQQHDAYVGANWVSNEGPFNLRASELPEEASDVLAAIIDAPQHVLEFIFGQGVRPHVSNFRLRQSYGRVGAKPVDFMRYWRELTAPS